MSDVNTQPIYNEYGLKVYDLYHKDENKPKLKFSVIEKEYKAKYIMEVALRNVEGGWVNTPVSLFYQKEKPKNIPGASNYFGLFFSAIGVTAYGSPVKSETVRITNAEAAVKDVVYTGVLCPDDTTVIYSAFRHDCQIHQDIMVDGGRDYLRTSSGRPPVSFKIDKDKLVLV